MSGLRKECKIAMKMSFSGKVKEELDVYKRQPDTVKKHMVR